MHGGVLQTPTDDDRGRQTHGEKNNICPYTMCRRVSNESHSSRNNPEYMRLDILKANVRKPCVITAWGAEAGRRTSRFLDQWTISKI